MSRVTDVILITFVEEEPCIEKFNDHIKEHSPNNQYLKNIGCHAGGNKYLQLECYAGGINYLGDLDGLLELFQSLSWEDPERTILIIQTEESERLCIYTIGKVVTENIIKKDMLALAIARYWYKWNEPPNSRTTCMQAYKEFIESKSEHAIEDLWEFYGSKSDSENVVKSLFPEL